MPRLAPVYSDVLYRPLTEDVEELLARFQQTESVRYECFSAVWRLMRFSDVFAGITRMGELKRFCGVALNTASRYFLGPFSYQIRVGGLYLLYAFYNAQLTVPQSRIRFALKDWEYIQNFLKESLHSRHYDVIYILRKLFAARAVHFVAMPHFLTFRKLRKHQSEPLCAGFLSRTMRVQELVYSELLDEVSNIQTLYQSRTKAVLEKAGLFNVAVADFPSRLQEVAGEFVAWQDKNFPADGLEEEEEEERPGETETTRRSHLVCSIKQKSYSSYKEAGRARRHRQPVALEPCDPGGPGAPGGERSSAVRRRPPSLRARTQKTLEVREETTTHL